MTAVKENQNFLQHRNLIMCDKSSTRIDPNSKVVLHETQSTNSYLWYIIFLQH